MIRTERRSGRRKRKRGRKTRVNKREMGRGIPFETGTATEVRLET